MRHSPESRQYEATKHLFCAIMFATQIVLLDMKGSVCLIALSGMISADATAAAEESKFAPNTETLVRKESFACKKISDLDRLIQLDGQGAFTSGMQLYQYSKRHNCVGLNRRVRVLAVQDDYVCVYDSREPELSPTRLDA